MATPCIQNILAGDVYHRIHSEAELEPMRTNTQVAVWAFLEARPPPANCSAISLVSAIDSQSLTGKHGLFRFLMASTWRSRVAQDH